MGGLFDQPPVQDEQKPVQPAIEKYRDGEGIGSGKSTANLSHTAPFLEQTTICAGTLTPSLKMVAYLTSGSFLSEIHGGK